MAHGRQPLLAELDQLIELRDRHLDHRTAAGIAALAEEHPKSVAPAGGDVIDGLPGQLVRFARAESVLWPYHHTAPRIYETTR